MITLKESSQGKLGGANSIFLSFNHNVEIEGIIKSSGTFNYDPKTHTWEVPITSLAYLLDNLTYFDDIYLILEKEDISNTYRVPILMPKTKSFKHQEEAVEFGLNHPKFLLLDSPGLGKTKSLINLAEELKAQEGIEHCLVICGINTLKTNWEKEIAIHSNLDSIIIGKKVSRNGTITYSSIKERVKQIMSPIKEFFIIINIESLRDDAIIKALNTSPNKIGMMLVDEMHKCKGTSASQSKNLLELECPHMVGATGTLILNSPIDTYIPLAWIGMEKKRNVTNFKRTFCIFDDITKGRIVGFKNMEMLKDEIERCSLRRTKDLLDLPPKNIINEYVEMSDAHRKFYNDVKNGVKEECDKINLLGNNLLSLVTRLRQATSCPTSLTSRSIESSKVERCLDLVEEITSNGDKVVIFSNFKEPIYHLESLLQEYSPLIGTGDMKDEDVSKNIDLFQNGNGEHKVFLGTIQKMGTGVTLTRASYLIFLDAPWTYSLFQQSCDRIHRIGSTKPVFIYNLICEDTIDETVARILDKKEAIGDYIIDDKVNDKALDILKQYILDLT